MTQNILLADSDITNLELMTAVLTRNGFQIESTNDGGDALARFMERTPQIVICDIELSGLGGLQLIQQIRQVKSDVRIILFCGTEQLEQDTLKNTADAVIERPFRYGVVKNILIDWGMLSNENESEEEVLTFSVPAPPSIDIVVKDTIASVEETTKPDLEANVQTNNDLVIENETENAAIASVPIPIPIPIAQSSDEDKSAESATKEVETSQLETQRADLSLPEEPNSLESELFPDTPVSDEEAPTECQELVDPDSLFTETGDDEAVSDESTVRSIQQTKQELRERKRSDSALPGSIPKRGDLTTIPLPRIIFEIYINTWSGKLHISRKSLKKTVCFWAGIPVHVEFEQLTESLGVLLREVGRITNDQYERAQQIILEKGMAYGQALLEIDAIRENELLEALNEQNERKLINAFAWRDGRYEIDEQTDFFEKEVLTEIRPIQAIWRGVREHYDVGSLFTFFAKLRKHYIVASKLYAVQLESIGPLIRDIGLDTFIDGQCTFENALTSDDTRVTEIAQGLYVLLVTDMVKPSTKPGSPAPSLGPVKVTESSTQPVDYRELMAIADRIAREYLRVKGKDHFCVLEVDQESTESEIEQAYHKKSKKIANDLHTAGLPHEALKRGRELQDIVSKAYRILSVQEQREAYLGKRPNNAGGDSQNLSRDTPAIAFRDKQKREQREKRIYAEQLFKEGSVLLEENNPESAQAKFMEAIKTNPTEATYRVSLARCLLNNPKLPTSQAMSQAFQFINEALQLDPGNILANLEVAQLFINSGQSAKARSYLEHVLKKAPHHQRARKLMQDITDN